MKSMFFTVLVCICIGIGQTMYAMEEGNKDGEIQNYSSVIDVPIYNEDQIQDYKAERDEKAVTNLAWMNLHLLTSIDRHKNLQEAFDTQIKSTLEDELKFTEVKVFLLDDHAKGYIVYRIGYIYPVYKALLKLCIPSIKPTKFAKIEHIAVAEDFQNKGIGKALMNYAIKDAQAAQVDYVKLQVAGSFNYRLEHYYEKHFGFRITDKKIISGSRGMGLGSGATIMKKRLKPYAVQTFTKKVLNDVKSIFV